MIHHVNLQVSVEQAERCAEFYELLGFERVHPGEELAARAVWLERAGQQIHLEHTPRDGEDVYGDPASGHVAFVVEDYDETVDALLGAGYEVDSRAQYWGSPRCFTYDPAGNRVEIMAFAPGSSG